MDLWGQNRKENIMNDKEYKALLEKIEEAGRRAEKDPTYARQLLVDAGICNIQGELREPYR